MTARYLSLNNHGLSGIQSFKQKWYFMLNMANSACNSKEYLSVFLEIKYSGYTAEVPFVYFLSHHIYIERENIKTSPMKYQTYIEYSNIIHRILKQCTQGSRFNKTSNFYCFIKDTQVKQAFLSFCFGFLKKKNHECIAGKNMMITSRVWCC